MIIVLIDLFLIVRIWLVCGFVCYLRLDSRGVVGGVELPTGEDFLGGLIACECGVFD